jgi:hypothetical protein
LLRETNVKALNEAGGLLGLLDTSGVIALRIANKPERFASRVAKTRAQSRSIWAWISGSSSATLYLVLPFDLKRLALNQASALFGPA